MAATQWTSDEELSDLVAIVTGANSGIGRATAVALASQGATVVLACRSPERARPVVDELVATTGNRRVEFLPLDLGDLDSVRTAAQTFLASGRPLHLLVNNAGVAGRRGLTASGFELAFGTNHVGHFLLTRLLLDQLEASAPTRVVNVSSSDHLRVRGIDWSRVREPTRTLVGRPEYSTSKLANVCFTQELARRHGDRGVSAFAVDPGPVVTDIWRPIPRPIYWALRVLIRMKPAEAGAAPTLRAALDGSLVENNGAYIGEDCSITPPSRHATPELAAELWRRSDEWVGTSST
jgi:NAD(P)-dependent dehydrogenase (short-subunit alcohol dehydrogenase family)